MFVSIGSVLSCYMAAALTQWSSSLTDAHLSQRQGVAVMVS